MKYIILSTLSFTMLAFADAPANLKSTGMASQVIAEATAPQNTEVGTNYEIQNDGIPWNHEFDSNRMVRHQTFDPALKVAYSYSLNFVAGSFGSFANQSFMAHFAYEFTPNLHLYANVGLWMPLYSNIRFGTPIAREDVRQGNVSVLIPDIALEYKPSDKVTFRVMYINERDAFRAYGPHRYFYDACPWGSPLYCR